MQHIKEQNNIGRLWNCWYFGRPANGYRPPVADGLGGHPYPFRVGVNAIDCSLPVMFKAPAGRNPIPAANIDNGFYILLLSPAWAANP